MNMSTPTLKGSAYGTIYTSPQCHQAIFVQGFETVLGTAQSHKVIDNVVFTTRR